MNIDLLYPVFAQVALTVLLAIATGLLRYQAVSTGAVKRRDIVLGQRAWPLSVQKISNAVNNQWETPILFYAAIAFALITEAQSAILLPAAWAYFASRVVHAGIYATSNFLPARFSVFILGVIALVVFWVSLAMEVMAR
jgi:hypothetical protein